jgi:dihydroxyacetone kinase DhaKLM complex PTS-EIIA-like component DhaM
MANSTQSADLDGTIQALQQEPSISADEAIAMINSWQQQLQGEDIAADLDELKQAIQSGDQDDIAAVLADLGEYTSEIAVDLPAEVSSKVQQIGMLLSQLAGE